MKKIKFQCPGKTTKGAPATQTVPINGAGILIKEVTKLRQNQPVIYQDTFLKHNVIKERQSVYISRDIHAGISRLVHVLALSGKDISVGGFIDNVLAEHMANHKEDIAELCRKQLDTFL